MGVTVATTRVAANTGTGTQDITTPDLGGLTPKAVILYCTRAITDGVPADGAGMYFGGSDGTNEFSGGYEEQHAQAAMVQRSDQNQTADRILTIWDGTASNTVDGAASFSAFITNGVRIDWTNAPADAFLITAIFFAGTDLSAIVGVQDLGNTADALIANTGVGFEADVVFTFWELGTAPGVVNFGVVHNNRAGTVTQRGIVHGQRNGFASSQVFAVMRDDAAIVKILATGALDYWGRFESFDSAGWDVQLGNARAPANADYAYLALRFGSSPVVSSKVYTYSTPTATGSNTDSGPGFEPQFVMYLLTRTAVANTIETDLDGGVFGVMVTDDDDIYTNSIASQDGAADSNTQSVSDNVLVFTSDTGGTVQIATLTSMGATGPVWDWIAVLAAADVWGALAIEVTSTADDLTADGATAGTPDLDNPTIGQTHALTASALATGAPTPGVPTLGQVHALSASGDTAGAPVLGTPTLVVVVPLSASGAEAGAPTLGTPAIGQVHALSASGVTAGSADLDTPGLGQTHALATGGLVTGSADLDTPGLGQEHSLSALGATTGTPDLDNPALGQEHGLSTSSLATPAPTLGTPTLAEVGPGVDPLAAQSLVTGSPTLGTPVLGQVHALTTGGLSTPSPVLGTPTLAAISQLGAGGLLAGVPVISSPAIGQVHVLVALGILSGVPTLGQPSPIPAYTPAPASRTTRAGAEARETGAGGEGRITIVAQDGRTSRG